MTARPRLRLAVSASLVASSVALTGCVSSPTYGTGKAATTQLAEDLTSVLSLAPKKREAVDYQPRPDLVRPAAGQDRTLPAPQEKLASSANPEWPESPEQKRARLKAEITANQDDPNYERPIVGAIAANDKSQLGKSDVLSPRAHDAGRIAGDRSNDAQVREEFNRRLAEQRQGSPTSRKYLSEPPLTYREPSATAAVDDVGEDELKKERRRKREAQKKSGSSSWRDLIPGL